MKLILTEKAKKILSVEAKYQGKIIRLEVDGNCCCGNPSKAYPVVTIME